MSYTRNIVLLRCILGFLAYGVLQVAPMSAQQAASSRSFAETIPRFEVATIKPSSPDDKNHRWNDSANRVSIENYTLRRLICVAYQLKAEAQVVGGPKWIDHQTFDIAAKIDDADVAKLGKMTSEARHTERNLMLQSLLAERFGLRMIWGERKLPIFALVVVPSGAKFTQSAVKNGEQSNTSSYNGQMSAANISMDEFAHFLAILDEVGDRVVMNRTNLKARYDLKLNFTRDHGDGVPVDAAYPGLFTALQEQLGLELKPDKGPVEVVIVKSASEPEAD